MKILYLTDKHLDYLADEVLYGLRTLLGSDVVDYPKKEILYASCRDKVPSSMVWSNGFTAFCLPDLNVDRDDIENKINANYYDIIINSSCWRVHTPIYKNLIVLDGEDHHYLHPLYLGRVIAYFKRELLWNVKTVLPIQFALPDHLLDLDIVQKTKLVHSSISVYPGIRQEIFDNFGNSRFTDWQEYILDIKKSWFGISPKGAGYDCQRHYEIFGNAILCIYLDNKAPRILKEKFVDGVNCITFSTVDELKTKIDHSVDKERLLEKSKDDLVKYHLASQRAKQVLDLINHRSRKIKYHFINTVTYGHIPYYLMRVSELAKNYLRLP